ncbi:MAG UNVERIFIED_CONTAM: hypothetical protein LVT10_21190 [Anaerolineae bacterium]|jgi:hypothetical protein
MKLKKWLWLIALLSGVAVVLLILDLLNHGMVWQLWKVLQSENTSTLPNEKRTVGETYKADVTFLS